MKVRDTITTLKALLDEFTEVFSPCAEENTPGLRLLDRFPRRVQFTTFDPKEERALEKRRNLLDTMYADAKADGHMVCLGVDFFFFFFF